MHESGLAAAERRLAETVPVCSEGGLSFRIMHWGMRWKHYDNPVHRHSFYEACYVLAGTGEYDDEGETFMLKPGVQFLSLPGHWHQIRSAEGLRLFYVGYEATAGERDGERTSEALAGYEKALFHQRVPIAEDPENVSALLWRALYRQAEFESAERLRQLAGMLLISFADVYGPKTRPEPAERAPAPSSSSQLVERARRFIRDNLSQPLRLADVASYLHVSDRHLSRMFRKHGGETFGQCLTRERMSAAERSLKTTVRSIKEIAEETGYPSVHYFTRVFAGYYGVSPARYRSRCMERFTAGGEGGSGAADQDSDAGAGHPHNFRPGAGAIGTFPRFLL